METTEVGFVEIFILHWSFEHNRKKDSDPFFHSTLGGKVKTVQLPCACLFKPWLSSNIASVILLFEALHWPPAQRWWHSCALRSGQAPSHTRLSWFFLEVCHVVSIKVTVLSRSDSLHETQSSGVILAPLGLRVKTVEDRARAVRPFHCSEPWPSSAEPQRP